MRLVPLDFVRKAAAPAQNSSIFHRLISARLAHSWNPSDRGKSEAALAAFPNLPHPQLGGQTSATLWIPGTTRRCQSEATENRNGAGRLGVQVGDLRLATAT